MIPFIVLECKGLIEECGLVDIHEDVIAAVGDIDTLSAGSDTQSEYKMI